MVQRIGKQRVQIPCLDKAKTTAVCHGIQLDPPGLAQQALLGQHHIQHLVAGVAVRIIKAGCALGLLDALRRHCFRRQLAEIGDLHLQFMAALIDDLHILPGNLILLTLALVQQVQSIHLFFHGRFLEQLTLKIQQGDKIELPDQNGGYNAPRKLFRAEIVQHRCLYHKQDADKKCAE